MKRAIALLSCVALSGVASADEDRAEDRASVEVHAAKAVYYVGEPIELRLWIGYDETYFREHAVSPFLQPMDVALKIEAPWLREWSVGVAAIDVGTREGDARGARRRVALNDGIVEATLLGRMDVVDVSASGGVGKHPPLTTLEIGRTFVATGPGDLMVPAPTLSFASATAFRDDLINGRVPVDRKDFVIHGEPRTIQVLPLPEAGRPAEFQGAIGSFMVTADVDRRVVTVGEHFHVTLRIEGVGNLLTAPTPRLDGLAGFHVYGAIDDKKPRVRTIVYDVAVLRPEVRELPPISFAYFDPEAPVAYRVVRTDRVPLEVRAVAGERKAPETTSDSSSGWLMGAIVSLLALFVLGLARRARSRVAIHPESSRATAAAVRFRERVGRPNADVAAAFAEFLAARLDCPAAAVVAPDLEARLLAQNWQPGLATRTALTLERLVAAGYGGGVDAPGADEVRVIVDEVSARAD